MTAISISSVILAAIGIIVVSIFIIILGLKKDIDRIKYYEDEINETLIRLKERRQTMKQICRDG